MQTTRSFQLVHGNLTTLCKGQLDDGLHFGKEGYNLLANLIVKKLQE